MYDRDSTIVTRLGRQTMQRGAYNSRYFDKGCGFSDRSNVNIQLLRTHVQQNSELLERSSDLGIRCEKVLGVKGRSAKATGSPDFGICETSATPTSRFRNL